MFLEISRTDEANKLMKLKSVNFDDKGKITSIFLTNPENNEDGTVLLIDEAKQCLCWNDVNALLQMENLTK